MATIDKLPNKTIEHGEWRMSIMAEPWSDMVKIWVGRRKPDSKLYTYNLKENGELAETVQSEGRVEGKPFLSMNLSMYYQFVELFNKAEVSVEENATNAELKATKYHLEDMRYLVLNTKAIKVEDDKKHE